MRDEIQQGNLSVHNYLEDSEKKLKIDTKERKKKG